MNRLENNQNLSYRFTEQTLVSPLQNIENTWNNDIKGSETAGTFAKKLKMRLLE